MSMRAQGSGDTGADASAVNRDILDSMTSLIKLVGGIAQGIAAKERLMGELAAKMPWSYALDDGERCCFLALLKKALGGDRPDVCPGGETPAGNAEPRVRSEHI